MKWAQVKILYWLAVGWLLFFLGYCWIIYGNRTNIENTILIMAPGVLLIVLALIVIFDKKTYMAINERLKRHTEFVDNIPDSQIHLWIVLATLIGLFVELMLIRIHASCFQLFAYFKNISLLSCFLGLGIGYARGGKKPLYTPFVLPCLALQISFMYLLRDSDINMSRWFDYPVKEQFALGIAQTDHMGSMLFVYGFIILVFTFNALCFIPLGQISSHLMMRKEKLQAYSLNLIGSLIGILIFTYISLMWCPPTVWFALAAAGLMLFYHKDIYLLVCSLVALLFVIIILTLPFHLDRYDIYSPYQILTLNLNNTQPEYDIETSNTYYQKLINLSDRNVKENKGLKWMADYYDMPYKFMPKPEDVLVVGSGSGNDVAAALRNGAVNIDAVEIDLAILKIGAKLHPEAPYRAENVTAYIQDARAYIRQSAKKYNLIVYGLLDSHTLLSGRSGGIRLDSYVYTVEGFREARRILKDGGIICVTFAAMNIDLGKKMFLMLKEAFDGRIPQVYQVKYDGGTAYIAGERLNITSLKPSPEIRNITQFMTEKKIDVDVSTDNWPFLYMPRKNYPVSYAILIIVLLAISISYIIQLVPGIGDGFSVPCFFLGAGFMLVETKGITELALVYGSTWIVISVIIASILLMAFLANLLVIKIGFPPRTLTYGLLYISLIAGIFLSSNHFLSLPSWAGKLIMTTVLTIPLFFSGFAFSAELKYSVSVPVALSSNLLGSMLGGFLEYNSMYFGFDSLYIFALGMYLIAFVGSMYGKAG